MANKSSGSEWIEVIIPKKGLFDFNLGELWNYRDLLLMYVKRDFVAKYKQTILGPLWFFLQPIITTIMFTIVFGKFAGLSSDGLPRTVFYLSGLTIWNYFASCFTASSNTFTANARIFGKVYFPRLIIPVTVVISNLIQFFIQFLLFLFFVAYFLFFKESAIRPNLYMLFTPFLLLIMAGISLGAGLIFSSLTTKYRDLTFLLSFGVQLLMYGTPVIYPVDSLPEKYRIWVMANPLSPLVEGFRYAFLGSGNFSLNGIAYSALWMILLLFGGILIFNRVERSFMDTV
jgi:lipopolysaccharide transport system permease protein